MSKVVLKNLIKSYDGKKNIINDINLEINDKEFVAPLFDWEIKIINKLNGGM